MPARGLAPSIVMPSASTSWTENNIMAALKLSLRSWRVYELQLETHRCINHMIVPKEE